MTGNAEGTSSNSIDFFKQADENERKLEQDLPGLFNLYYELASSTSAENVEELMKIRYKLGLICLHLSGWGGIDQVATQLFNNGIANSRDNVLQLISPLISKEDSARKESAQNIILVGVVGRISSGKGTVGEIIAKQFGGFHTPLSDRLKEIARSYGHLAPFSRDVLRKINDELKPRFGKPVFVRWTVRTATNIAQLSGIRVVSMDGFRSLEEAQYFSEQGGILIAVIADDETRFERLKARNRAGDDFTRADFDNSDAVEKEWIDPIFDIADAVIENNGSYEELEQKTLEVLNRYIQR